MLDNSSNRNDHQIILRGTVAITITEAYLYVKHKNNAERKRTPIRDNQAISKYD